MEAACHFLVRMTLILNVHHTIWVGIYLPIHPFIHQFNVNLLNAGRQPRWEQHRHERGLGCLPPWNLCLYYHAGGSAWAGTELPPYCWNCGILYTLECPIRLLSEQGHNKTRDTILDTQTAHEGWEQERMEDAQLHRRCSGPWEFEPGYSQWCSRSIQWPCLVVGKEGQLWAQHCGCSLYHFPTQLPKDGCSQFF